MGNNADMGNNQKNNKQDQPKKKPTPPPPRVGRKKKNKGVEAAAKLPSGTLFPNASDSDYQVPASSIKAVENKGLLTDVGRVRRTFPVQVDCQEKLKLE